MRPTSMQRAQLPRFIESRRWPRFLEIDWGLPPAVHLGRLCQAPSSMKFASSVTLDLHIEMYRYPPAKASVLPPKAPAPLPNQILTSTNNGHAGSSRTSRSRIVFDLL